MTRTDLEHERNAKIIRSIKWHTAYARLKNKPAFTTEEGTFFSNRFKKK